MFSYSRQKQKTQTNLRVLPTTNPSVIRRGKVSSEKQSRNGILRPEKKVWGISQGSEMPTPGQGDQNQSNSL